jgi:hypothetical protein
MREAMRSQQNVREAHEESLATTPMTFEYGSGDLVPGFDTRSPVRDALEQAGNNLIGGFALLIVLLVTLLPWAALALFGWWLFRRFRARSAPKATEASSDYGTG